MSKQISRRRRRKARKKAKAPRRTTTEIALSLRQPGVPQGKWHSENRPDTNRAKKKATVRKDVERDYP
jgi:hypothetical protein